MKRNNSSGSQSGHTSFVPSLLSFGVLLTLSSLSGGITPAQGGNSVPASQWVPPGHGYLIQLSTPTIPQKSGATVKISGTITLIAMLRR